MAKIAESKKKVVAEIIKYCKEYPIIGIVNMENLPAPQLQAMKSKLRDKVKIFMTKKRLMKVAFEKLEKDFKGIKDLEKSFKGMPAILFTKDSPFKLSKTLKENKSSAPAKAGQEAPNDIIVPAGPTPFAPGPVISELGSIGIKTGVENGKVAVKEDTVVVKAGETINANAAGILTRLGIEPMEVGLDLLAAYENGTIYSKDILSVDDKEYLDKLNNACKEAFNLAMFIEYPTKDTIESLIGKAFNDAKAIGLSQNIIDEGIIDELLAKAEKSALSVKSAGNIEVPEKEEKPARQENKEEPEKDEKTEEKEKNKEQPSEKEVAKAEKEEEEVLEKEKEIIEEEKAVEKEAEEKKKEESSSEQETEQAIKEEKEKQLEAERIEQEKKLEEIEKKKAQQKKDIDAKVKDMVEQTKKHAAGDKEPSAEEILKETEENLPEKEEKKDDVPSIQELDKKKKEEEQKKVEELAKKLTQKGTLRE